MSSADPTDVVSPKGALSKSPRSKTRLGNAPAAAIPDDADVQAEKPQPRPEERKTDPKNPEADQAEEPGSKGIVGAFRKHPIAMIVCFGLIAIGVIAGIVWYLHARHYESTDDAFIDSRPVLVSPEVSGSIISVNVTDNQIVKKGDLLATIDTRNYKAALEQANGLIAQNEATAKNIDAQITAQKATIEQASQQVTEAQAALKFSTDENNRYQDLVQKGAGTLQRAQQASSDLKSKQAALDAATAAKLVAERQIDVLNAQKIGATAQLEQAKAQRDRAVADLQRTELRASVDGRVAKLTAAVGALAAPGQSIMVIVPLDVWVTANFKESQLAKMRVGQPVDIEVDAFSRTFPGHVDSVQAGSGTAFSLLPAENATGNYVKVVQRVPVKITFDQRPDVELGLGMSVVPTVTVRP
ncbi:MAG: HlyD family secretion protein [Bradyrhizobium sp.]|uniref:HlyD family secretion protein n=1 Tax=Bradyrhizobium sp. TaxID=376 RepID=UPI001C291C80|nr:HlyD family secretion protein [Bradyrhizobium sp.]MBU6461521.1 HlyD family secretion protein [Pseudomonadota bacterium]MDE2066326.1 HlyD family secretion protein [Bradyrhizobium sp.]MDE2241129.1 HlyD family secretion protein [Bradyrhizobium sp.]MDE2472130.1 HlyD family secretion protein [Bradyrhizobium sp.]